MPLEPGVLVNSRYRLGRVVRRIGRARLYQAQDEQQGRACLLQAAPCASPEAERAFQRVAARLISLRHPGLPRVLDHFAAAGQQWLVLDLVEGEDLEQRLARQGPLPERLVLRWAGQLCAVLGYLHDLNPPVLHGGLQPSAILLTPRGEACLLGLGLSLPAEAGPQPEPTGFAAPELLAAGRADTRLDQYALAATLYALLTGQAPPDSGERRVGNAALVPPQVLRSDLSPSTGAALVRALSLQPAQRFASLAAFGQALLRPPSAAEATAVGHREPPTPALAPEPPPAEPSPADTTAVKPAADSPPPGTFGGTVFRPLSPDPSDPLDTLQEPPGSLPPDAPLPPPIVIIPPAGWQSDPSPHPARPRWLLPASGGCGLVLLLALVLAGGSALRGLVAGPASTATGAARVVAQASGTLAATTTPPAATVSSPTRAAQPTRPSETPRPATATPAARPSPGLTRAAPRAPVGGGGRLAFISNRDGRFFQIYTMNVDGSDARQVTVDPVDKWSPDWDFNGTQLAWSPDGARLLYVAAGVDGATDIWVVDADGRNPRNLTAAAGDDFQPSWCSDGQIWFASTRTNRIHQIFTATFERLAAGERPANFSSTHNSPREFDPAPYPDCERAMFTTTLDGPNEIWRFWPGCAGCLRKVRSLKAQGGLAEEPALSPDGLRLAYTRVQAEAREIAVGAADDLGLDAQLTGSRSNYSAQWSPDGQWLVFVSERDGNREIYRMDAGGAGQTNLTQHDAIDTDPVWQPASP